MKSLARLPEAQRVHVLKLFASDTPTEAIAGRFGITAQSIRRCAARLGIRKGQMMQLERHDISAGNAHAVARQSEVQKRQSRGFSVPSELESTYFSLIISGMSRQQAAHTLGIIGSPIDRQAAPPAYRFDAHRPPDPLPGR